MGIVRDLFYAKKMSAGQKLPAPSSAVFLKRKFLANNIGGEKTYSGPVVSFIGRANTEILALTAAITPVQSFNGYDHPWPAGGGVNQFDGRTIIGRWKNNGQFDSARTDWSSSENPIPVVGGQSNYVNFVCYRIYYDSSMRYVSADSSGSLIATTPSNASYMHITQTTVDWPTDVIVAISSSAVAYSPYENICPITGRTGANVYVSPTENVADATTYAVAFGDAGTVYGCTVDVVSGALKARPYIASYTGETLVGPWVSSMDAYTPGGTPTVGAQVVDMGGVETSYQLTPQTVSVLIGQNYVWSDTGDVTVTVIH